MSEHLISLMIFFPFLGVLCIACLPRAQTVWLSLASSLASSICAIILIFSMQTNQANLQAWESFVWMVSCAVNYDMGVDGLNVLIVLLIALLFPVLIASEWNQKVGMRGMHALFLILQSALIGATCAQDLFLQFFFWGLSSLPFYFLAGIWGGAQREKVAFRSMVVSSLGNFLFFAALVLIYYSVEPHSFSLKRLMGGVLGGKTFVFLESDFSVSHVAFFLMSAGLSLRVPIWPIHGWFKEMAQQACPSVFVAFAGGMIPVALYIFARASYFLFPDLLKDYSFLIIGMGMVNLIMGGLCAFAQRSLNCLLAFVCLGEIGLVLMGLGSLDLAGVIGGIYQQLVFGLAIAGFGLFSGVIVDRTEQGVFSNEKGEKLLGGILVQAPVLSMVAGIVIASLLGFPGFAGFVSHSLVMVGSYAAHPFSILVAGSAFLLTSYYLLMMYRFVFLGQSHMKPFQDLEFREKAYFLPIVLSLLFFGFYPKPLLDFIRPTVIMLLSMIH